MQPMPFARAKAMKWMKFIEEPQCQVRDLMRVLFLVAAAFGQCHDRLKLLLLAVWKARNRDSKTSVTRNDSAPQESRFDFIPDHGDSHRQATPPAEEKVL
jgi:hypothetical protein